MKEIQLMMTGMLLSLKRKKIKKLGGLEKIAKVGSFRN